MRGGVPLASGALFAVAFLGGCAAPSGGLSADGSVRDGAVPLGSVTACTAYAYHAIEQHVPVTSLPAACGGLTSGQVSLAAGTAIREAAGGSAKAESRSRTAGDARWVSALITQPSPPRRAPSPPAIAESGGPGGGPGGGRLGGISDLAVRIAALLAWLVTAASGAFMLLRWLLAGGSLRARGSTSAPPPVMAGHAGFALTGLLGWTLFTITGWAWLGWACLVVLLPVAGLGMGVLLLGLPTPARGSTGARSGKKGVAWPVIAGHGIAAVALLLLVITAAVAA